jgi:putative oxidoreductase
MFDRAVWGDWRMDLRRLIVLTPLAAFADLALLALRLLAGAFLMHGTLDNIESEARMREFAGFLKTNGFVYPEIMAPLSVYAQFICGALFALGLLTRWAGLVMAFNFVVAVYMVHWAQDFRGWWPAIVLVFKGNLSTSYSALARDLGFSRPSTR